MRCSDARALKLDGSVAECGVYKGEFASVINRCFYDRKLYLFDIFEGFDLRDVETERGLPIKGFWKAGLIRPEDLIQQWNG